MVKSCRVCKTLRPLAELIVVRGKRETFHLCRPTVDGADPMCFRRGTGSVLRHQIEAPVPSEGWSYPVRPNTPEWEALLRGG